MIAGLPPQNFFFYFRTVVRDWRGVIVVVFLNLVEVEVSTKIAFEDEITCT